MKTLHSLLDISYPDKDLMQLKLTLRGLARSKQHVPKQARPVTPFILKEMFLFVDIQQEFDMVCWSIILLFFLMARKSNFVPTSVKQFDPNKQLLRKDIQVLENMLVVNIKWSKTRQFGHSRQIPVLAMPNSCLCPVTAYNNMISKVSACESDPAFCIHAGSRKNKLIPVTLFTVSDQV